MIQIMFGAMGIIVVMIGLAMALVPIILRRNKQKRCTQQVVAKCVKLMAVGERTGIEDVDVQLHGIEEISPNAYVARTPIYEIQYDGEIKHIYSNTYSTTPDVAVGDEKTLMVNPDNLNDYYDPNKKMSIITKVIVGMGIIIFISGLNSFFIFNYFMHQIIYLMSN